MMQTITKMKKFFGFGYGYSTIETGMELLSSMEQGWWLSFLSMIFFETQMISLSIIHN